MKTKNVYSFKRLAEYVVRKEVDRHLSEWGISGVDITYLTTSFRNKAERDQPLRKTVTVWFEIASSKPRFWDLQPVIIVFKGHQLYLSDICERAQERVIDSLRRFRRRQIASMA